MLPSENIVASFSDFGGLAALRAHAASDPAAALDEVAQQFESLFVQMMLKSMRATTGDDPLLGNGGELFTELLDEQLSLTMSQGEGLGIAAMLKRQLAAFVPSDSPAEAPLSRSPNLPLSRTSGLTATESVIANQLPPQLDDVGFGSSPHAFIQALWPHAQVAARSLGVDPRLLIAQAALETGWGRSVIHDEHGRNSFNLFGIKADQRWQGNRAEVSTLEYTDGVLVRTRAPFRAYASIAESFSDYVQFISSQSRYQGALQQAGDPRAYIRALQDAGYATDPEYANKILDVFKRQELSARELPATTGS